VAVLAKAGLIGWRDHVDAEHFEHLREIDNFFAHRWDVFVISTLVVGPLRFNQLSYDVSMHTRTKIPDSTLVRIRDRLMRAGIMNVANDPRAPCLRPHRRRPSYRRDHRGARTHPR